MESKAGYNKFNPKEMDEFIKKYFKPKYADDEKKIIAFYSLVGDDRRIIDRQFMKYFIFFSNIKLFNEEDFVKKLKNNEFNFFDYEITQKIIKNNENLDSCYKGKDEQAYNKQQINKIIIDCRENAYTIPGLTINIYFNENIELAIDFFKKVYSITNDKKIKDIIENLEEQLKVFEE